MRRAVHRFGAGFVGGLLATMLAGSGMVAFAEQVAEDLEMGDEAWFFRHRDPIEPVPPAPGELSDATEIPRQTARERTNPYNTETVHVGVNLGEDEAITFLGLPMGELGFGARILGGTITLPISGFGGPQARNAENADMVACVATDLIVDAHGGNWDTRYGYDCAIAQTEVVLEEGSDPLTWTVDLAAFTAVWDPDGAVPPGIAIVPNPESELSPPEQTWHVSWQNRFYQPTSDDDPEKRPISVTVRYEEEELPDFGEPGPATDPGGFQGTTDFPAASPQTFQPSRSQPFTPGAATGFAPPRAEDPSAADGEPPVEEGFAVEEDEAVAAPPMEPTADPNRIHPSLFLLPFLAVGLAGLLGYSLTQQPVLPHAREGAVSALMRKRRTAAVGAAPAEGVTA